MMREEPGVTIGKKKEDRREIFVSKKLRKINP